MTDNTVKTLDLQRIWLASGLVLAFAACLGVMLFRAVPPESQDIVVYMIGQLSGMATMALGFYFTSRAGQDAQDARKTENTGKALEAITAAASGTVSPDAKQAADQVAEAAAEEADKITR